MSKGVQQVLRFQFRKRLVLHHFSYGLIFLVIENIQYHREDVEPKNASNIEELLCQTRIITIDKFLIDDDEFKDDMLEEYNDEKIDLRSCNSSNEQDELLFDEDNQNLCLVQGVPLLSSTGPVGNSGSSSDRLYPKRKRIREESYGIIMDKEL
ncbi:hypothetical protein TorRG33x02_210190 [Trema orientale]|uniref:Uncharacterized protein n=1 Tax=Trema orientale TaxID=63057 RepID=A0A2P5ECB6_TREOI|nr:hypothetical protein TorRG33x02_210190 [Trema orientale]